MKEKPQKPAKSSKKAKGDPEPEPELTPKQLKEKRREEARAKAAETRKIVTAGVGQWTGKLPAQLLNEHAQKMKWERVEYPLKAFGRDPDQEWVGSVILARRNAKTKEIERVRFDPPADRVARQKTQVEARNYAATYGMHRVLSHRNMKMMLPPAHRDLWILLDEDKARAKEHEKYKWDEDPWQAEKDHKLSRQKFEQARRDREERLEHERIAMEAQREADTASHGSSAKSSSASKEASPSPSNLRPKRVRFNNTLIMSRTTRSILERVIRENKGFRFSTANALSKAESPEKHAQLSQMLEKLGFYKAFVQESLEYTSTLSTALAWLLIHVPEDDLPKKFMPTEIGFTARISSNMAVETVSSQLQSFGYSEDVARESAESTDGTLASSIIALTSSFVNAEQPPPDSNAQGDPAMWAEEMESLAAMLDPSQLKSGDSYCTITSRKMGASIKFFEPPAYPSAIPGIAVEPLSGTKMAKVVQLETTRRAAIYADSTLKGDYMIMALFEHMEDTFSEILKTPVKLVQISSAIIGVDESHQQAAQDLKGGSRRSKRPQRTKKTFDPDQVVQAKEKRMGTPAGRAMLESRSQLPAWQKQKEISDLVNNHQIVMITGETGSGKSTQVVQFILDSSPTAQIICTQPRRISAIGVAQRVADERLVSTGDQVGYVIRGEAKIGPSTQIRFVTSGVLLRMLQDSASRDESSNSDLDGLSHIVVDEVHERSLDGDFLLILLKKLVQKRPNLRVILMSATVDPKQFFDYFAPSKVGYVHITGRTFPVEQHFIDKVLSLTGYQPDQRKNSKDGSEEPESNGKQAVKNKDIGKIIGAIRDNSPGRVDYELVAATIGHIHRTLQSEGDQQGSILIFMSGAAEIDQALRAIQKSPVASKLWALPLHAALPPAEQKKVFKTAPRGLRKVVASTNVAETSITISDIVAVVDTGRAKETVYDPEANITRLVDSWISQAAATQRMGRAGRVRPGTCYKLYTENVQNSRMSPRPIPEILRSPLENLYLSVKAMGVDDVELFLSKAIDPPKSVALGTARQSLVAYGAIDPINNSLTPLGRHMAVIPTDPRTAKLLILGAMLGCLGRSLTVAAILSVGKPPFITNRNDEDGKNRIKETYGVENGDLIAACEAIAEYEKGTHDRDLVSRSVCRDVISARRQLLTSLIQIGFIEPGAGKGGIDHLPDELLKHNGSLTAVRAVISASLQPNIVEVVPPQQKFMATSGGTIEKDAVDDARQIKYYGVSGERLFIHPRSMMFGQTSFVGAARYLSYGTDIMTTKHFMADVTPVSNYGLILFASRIGVDPLGNGLIVDKWTGMKCWPRAGILVQFLQQLFGTLLDEKFKNPGARIIDHPVVKLVHDLLENEGKPQELSAS